MGKIDDFIKRHEYRKSLYEEGKEAMKNIRNLPDLKSGVLCEATRSCFEICEKMAFLEKGVLEVLNRLKNEVEQDD